ncbi:MAG: translation initiation factor IF-2 subunit beta [Candidatus Hadarchaeum yellowstonense]|jgi:translation initiation factor 2 subunit 2|uniref:Translation initiation factor 2 subunit beta n=1 Tax=Hadarchaeum yellowstonense TaxID=1776334 RepID=A0A147JX30_HADYE|nr:MAG: translation initiation factor IF-2 subunit beta [Candidatus Hadarchaeum yellowstonense]
MMEEEYEKLLDRAIEQIPKTVFESSRFQIPEADVSIVGNRTLLRNFKAIAAAFNREPEHLMKYLLRELGAAGDIQGTQAVFQGKFSPATVQERIQRYAEEFVLCKECGKPDTRLEKRERVYVLRCEACGARNPVRGV